MTRLSDDELLDALGVDTEIAKTSSHSPREERIIAGFEEIQRFVDRYGRAPQHGEDNDIFERLYAVRLDRLRALEECRDLLVPLDYQGLLSGAENASVNPVESMDDDELLAALEGADGPSSITELRHVRSRAEIRAAEEIAKREKCEDFEHFRPLFDQVEREIKSGVRQTRPFGKDASVNTGNFFILGGQLVYVAEKGDEFRAPNGHPDARLRVIYSNGTESNLLLRSLQRALYKDEAGRRVTEPVSGPLFSSIWDEGDIESGTIYVLRSLSNHPFIAEHRELIHKIGVTGGKVETRIANAAHDATYLLADVEVVATYKLAGINRTKLEGILHRIFAPAQLDLTIHDRFGHPVRPKEWFLVPLHVIDEAVRRIRDGSITNVAYDPRTASLVCLAQ
ncbi:GIY-YIG nuclease family protein [Brevibacillus thermoruber]|uniref:GIY-YIG nuclease family protein n=1 Tax=Brevibacillus thermoruber TaxID=33942 RepID=UPI00054DBD82|nr:GIY-YIG nuclease family protein [Brevibacillus thermoruber]